MTSYTFERELTKLAWCGKNASYSVPFTPPSRCALAYEWIVIKSMGVAGLGWFDLFRKYGT